MLESCVYKMLVCWGLLGERGDVDGWGFLGERGLSLIHVYGCRKQRWCSWKINISVVVVVELE